MRSTLLLPLLLGACGSSEPAIDGLVFDPCVRTFVRSPDATTAQRAAIAAALAMWHRLGVDAAVLDDVDGAPAPPNAPVDAPVIDVRWQEANPRIYGFYDPELGAVSVNTRLVEPHAVAVTIAHELGHAFGLLHVEPDARSSVMNPGNLVREPDERDAQALLAPWQPCAAPLGGPRRAPP